MDFASTLLPLCVIVMLERKSAAVLERRAQGRACRPSLFLTVISFDSMNQFPEEALYVDYLYVSRIEYEDGSLWEDPFGLTAFK